MKHILFVLVGFFSAPLFAASCFDLGIDIAPLIRESELKPLPVGVESEVELSKILPFVESANGKVSGLKFLEPFSELPSSLLQNAGARSLDEFINRDFVRSTSVAFKELILQFAINRSLSRGASNKSLPGLVIEEAAIRSQDLDWESPSQPGQQYQIEFKIASEAAHAAALHENLWRTESRLFSRQHSHHVHALFRFSPERLKDPFATAGEFVDVWIRLNYLAEFQTILLRQSPVSRMFHGDLQTWGPLSPPTLFQGIDHLSHLVVREKPAPLSSREKMAWVAFRGQGLYRDPSLIGVEFRAANYKGPNLSISNLINVMQRQLNRMEHETDPLPSFARWWGQRTTRRDYRSISTELQRIFAPQWYIDTWPSVWRKYDSSGLPPVPPEIRAALQNEDKKMENRMLFFDWSRQLQVVASDPDMAQRVRTLQERTLAQLPRHATPDQLSAITRQFIRESGLYEYLFRSL